MAPMPLENERAYFAASRPARLFCRASRVGFEDRAYAYSSCVFREYVEVRQSGGVPPPVRGSGFHPHPGAFVDKRVASPGSGGAPPPHTDGIVGPARTPVG